MKRKLLEAVPYSNPKKKGSKMIVTAQITGDYLVLDVYQNGKLRGRQGMDTRTGEYAQLVGGKWSEKKFGNLLGLDMKIYGYYSIPEARKQLKFRSSEEEDFVRKMLNSLLKYGNEQYHPTFNLIDTAEQEYARDKREQKEFQRIGRVKGLMARIPEVPRDIRDWIYQCEGEDFAFPDQLQRWHCTACGRHYERGKLCTEQGKIATHNQYVLCPRCGKRIQAKTRTLHVEKRTHFLLLQSVDNNMGVARFFDAKIGYGSFGKQIFLNESIRIMLYRQGYKSNSIGKVYYNQDITEHTWEKDDSYFDYRRNPAIRRTHPESYLYPDGIAEALAGTMWQDWTNIFQLLASGKQKLDYNRMMMIQSEKRVMGLVEMLYRGRFYHLLSDTVDHTSLLGNGYSGILNPEGETITEVFGIRDRQRICRIRDLDGGEDLVAWMRYEEETGVRIPQEVLIWLQENELHPVNIVFLNGKMSVVQVKNYVQRQQANGYRGKKALQIISQWADYLSMYEKMGKRIDDAMIYRPADLKRYHDEAVAEIERQRNEKAAKEEAARMKERFPMAETILKEVQKKYEYRNEKYAIVVPNNLVEIMQDSRALHHCAGASDRYFDRIVQRETYLCFLRRADAPEIPYYTIEVEPGGTIRQHRGMYDEEPNIEEIKPFLREWQKEIRARIGKEELCYAKESARKRQQNIEELREKKNTKVLKGLMEDLMEAI